MAWNRSSPVSREERGGTTRTRRIFRYGLALAVVLGALVCALIFLRGDRSDDQIRTRRGRGLIESRQPRIGGNVTNAVSKRLGPERLQGGHDPFLKQQLKEMIKSLNTNGWVIVPAPKQEVAFDSMFEQQLCWLFTTEPGDPPPPLLPIEDHDRNALAEILISKLKVGEKDSDDAVVAKESVNLAKKEVIRYLKSGGDPEDFIKEYNGLLAEAHEKWESATDKIRMAIEAGEDPVAVKEYIRRIDRELAEEGIKAADVPLHFQRYMDEEQDEN